MSGRLRVARITVLGVMRSLGQVFSIVVVQLLNLVKKKRQAETLTRSVGLSYNLTNPHDLVISRCCKKITPNGLTKLVLFHKHHFGPETWESPRKILAKLN